MLLQSENSNRRLSYDLARFKRWAGDDWSKIRNNLIIHTLEEDTDTFLYLSDLENCARIEQAIMETKPDVVVWDALKDFQAGNLNEDAQMQRTLSTISQVTKRGNPHRIPVIVHHAGTGRAGAMKAVGYDRNSFGRNSKVLQFFTRAQINVVAYGPDDNERLIIASGKCNNEREFQPFGIRLNTDTMIYEIDSSIDIECWQKEISGSKKQKLGFRDLPVLMRDLELSKQDIVQGLLIELGVNEKTAYRWITQCVDEGLVVEDEQTGKFRAARNHSQAVSQ